MKARAIRAAKAHIFIYFELQMTAQCKSRGIFNSERFLHTNEVMPRALEKVGP